MFRCCFFVDRGLRRSQQMFADLNKHAIRPSDSLSTLYDLRDPSSELARYVAITVESFRGMTDMEKSSLSKRSTKLFTLSSIKHASRALLRKGRRDGISHEERVFATEFWTLVALSMPDWNLAKKRKLASSDLRQNFIHAHGVALQAIGTAGADLVAAHPKGWQDTPEEAADHRLVKIERGPVGGPRHGARKDQQSPYETCA